MIIFVAILLFLFAITSVFITLAAVISVLPLVLAAAFVVLLYRLVAHCFRQHSVL